MLKLVPNLSGRRPGGDVHHHDRRRRCRTTSPGPRRRAGGDGVLDTFPGVSGGQQICFDVIPKMNTMVMNTDKPQMFRALLSVKGVANGSTVNLGVPRDVFFLVPPKIMNGPIP